MAKVGDGCFMEGRYSAVILRGEDDGVGELTGLGNGRSGQGREYGGQ